MNKLEQLRQAFKIVIDKKNPFFDKELTCELFTFLNNLTTEDEIIQLDNISPFIYQTINPSFELKQIHWDYLIFEHRRMISQKFCMNLSDVSLVVDCNYLSSQITSTFNKETQQIIIYPYEEFVEFLKTHEIKINNTLSTPELLVSSFLQSKLFFNENKKVKGHLNLLLNIYQSFETSKSLCFLDEISKHLIFDNIDFSEFLNYLKSLGAYKRKNKPLSFHFPDQTHFLSEDEIKFKNFKFGRDKNIVALNLKKSKLQLLNEMIELSEKRILDFLNFDTTKSLDNNIECLSKISNWKNKIKYLTDFINNKKLNVHNLLSFFSKGVTINPDYDFLFLFCKFWIDIAKKYKYNDADLDYLIGRFESDHYKILFNPHNEESISYKTLLNSLETALDLEVKQKKLKKSIPYVTPVQLEYDEIYGYKIYELYNQNLLDDEGNFQKHCIAGYRPNENVKLFSIRWEDKRHTIMVSTNNGQKFSVAQSCGYKNKSKNNYDEKTRNALDDIEKFIVSSVEKSKRKQTEKSEEDVLLDELFE